MAKGSFTFNICSRHKHTSIVVAGRRVPMGSEDFRIQLEEPTRQVDVSCGGNSDTIYWTNSKKDGNQVRVSFVENVINVHVYLCDSFGGPKKAGIRCAVEAYSPACPGQVGDNHTCVYEVKTTRFSSDTVRKAVQVTTEVAVRVREKARVSVGVSHTKEHTVVNTYSVDSRSYIVIPAGYGFCSFIKAVSKKDNLAETGFKWSCTLPTFVQTNMISGRCTNLAQCESKSPCSTTHSRKPDSAAKSTVAQP